jgi:ADP-ribose pyrophosphatase
MDRSDPDLVQLIEHRTVYQGTFRVDRYRLRHRLHEGPMGPTVEREVFERGHVVAVLPVDLARDQVVLIEQFRPGAYAAGWHPWLIECVAGIVEPGEAPEEVAVRECREETGLEVTDLVPLARCLSSPGACTETTRLFCGRVDARRASGVHGLADEGEDIRVTAWPVDEAIALLDQDRIVNAKTIIALQWLALHRETLRERWVGA